jgi:hypothetical protein
MFTVLQRFDFSGKPLGASVVRTVYAVDRATNSFLTTSFMGDFIWIPINSCEPYTGEEETK